MNRTYEIMFIVRPDVEEAELDKLVEGFSANVTSGGGEVKSVEKMGRRRSGLTLIESKTNHRHPHTSTGAD